MHLEILKDVATLDPKRIDWAPAFVAIEELPPADRGRWLEKLFVALLRRDGLDAWLNPGAGRPRQTDAGFRLENTFFLVETKWRSSRANVNDLDSLRTRVVRNPAGTAGCLLSVEGFTSGLVEDLRQHRATEVVLIEGDELRSVVLGESIATLLSEKRKRFRVDGEVWFRSDEDRRARPLLLPPSRYDVRSAAGELASLHLRTGHHAGVHFMIDTFEVETYWPTASIELVSRAEDVDDLARILSCLNERLQLDDEGSFTIQQRRDSWFGFGAERFIAQLRAMDDRYKGIEPQHVHHSEDAAFASHFSGGFLVATTRQRTLRNRHLHSTRIEILMNGIPLDLEPLRCIAREIDGRDVQIRVRQPREEGDRSVVFLKDRPTVDVVGLVCGSDEAETYVEGVVVNNPFFGRPDNLVKLAGDVRWARNVAEMDLLVCWLRSSHGVPDKVDAYRLQRIEWRQVGSLDLLTAEVDWDELDCHCGRTAKPHRTGGSGLSASHAAARVRDGMKASRDDEESESKADD